MIALFPKLFARRPKRKPVLVYAANRRQAEAAERAFNGIAPNSAVAVIAPCDFHDWFEAWHAGNVAVLILSYNQFTGFRAPEGTTVMLLDGCPSDAHRVQCESRAYRVYARDDEADPRDALPGYLNPDGN